MAIMDLMQGALVAVALAIVLISTPTPAVTCSAILLLDSVAVFHQQQD